MINDSEVIISKLIHIHTMPTRTNRQLASDAVHRAFFINFVADLEQRELDFDSDSGFWCYVKGCWQFQDRGFDLVAGMFFARFSAFLLIASWSRSINISFWVGIVSQEGVARVTVNHCLPPIGDISNEISNETQMKAKWATLKNPNVLAVLQYLIYRNSHHWSKLVVGHWSIGWTCQLWRPLGKK